MSKLDELGGMEKAREVDAHFKAYRINFRWDMLHALIEHVEELEKKNASQAEMIDRKLREETEWDQENTNLKAKLQRYRYVSLEQLLRDMRRETEDRIVKGLRNLAEQYGEPDPDFRQTGLVEEAAGELLNTVTEAVQRETAEECCKLQCGLCADGEKTTRRQAQIVHIVEGREWSGCYAAAIRVRFGLDDHTPKGEEGS